MRLLFKKALAPKLEKKFITKNNNHKIDSTKSNEPTKKKVEYKRFIE